MNYKQHHKALLELQAKLIADNQLRTSYVSVLSAVITKVKKLAEIEKPASKRSKVQE